MYMGDWLAKLDEFIKITGNDILNHSGLEVISKKINAKKK
jgi:hypothetical protein